jgi:hypothetical protein
MTLFTEHKLVQNNLITLKFRIVRRKENLLMATSLWCGYADLLYPLWKNYPVGLVEAT